MDLGEELLREKTLPEWGWVRYAMRPVSELECHSPNWKNLFAKSNPCLQDSEVRLWDSSESGEWGGKVISIGIRQRSLGSRRALGAVEESALED